MNKLAWNIDARYIYFIILIIYKDSEILKCKKKIVTKIMHVPLYIYSKYNLKSWC